MDMKRIKMTNKIYKALILICSLILLQQCTGNVRLISEDKEEVIIRSGQGIEFVLIKDGFRYSFRKTDGTFLVPAHPVSGLLAGAPKNLSQAELTQYIGEKDSVYSFEGETYTATHYIDKAKLTGLMALFNGKVYVEYYNKDINSETKFHLWSATRSYTSILVGIALKEGKINSLEDLVQKYAPQFKGTAYGETPIKYLMMMSSGIDFFHFKGDPDRLDMYKDIMLYQKDFDKWTAVIRGAYNKPYIEIVQEKLWEPGGFTSDAQAPFQEPRLNKNGNVSNGYSIQWWLPKDYDQEFIASGAIGQYLHETQQE